MTACSDTFLLPHLKDLSSQHVVVSNSLDILKKQHLSITLNIQSVFFSPHQLFLQYLQFLYLKYSQDASPQRPGGRSPSLTQVCISVLMRSLEWPQLQR